MMEGRRMDAALLVLLAGYLAAALEVPLDRKTTHHTCMSDSPYMVQCQGRVLSRGGSISHLCLSADKNFISVV